MLSRFSARRPLSQSGWRGFASCFRRISTVPASPVSCSVAIGVARSEQEQQEFLKLFEDYVVFVYGTRLSNFNGETFKVRGSRTDESGTIVSTDILSPSGEAPIKVDWRLVTDKGVFKINDVIIEGISMLVTQRSEFASVIQRHGGQVGGLLTMMRERARTASAAQ